MKKIVNIMTSLFMRFIWIGVLLIFQVSIVDAAPPLINEIDIEQVNQGATYTRTPTLSAGADVKWRKAHGPDDVAVNGSTGEVTWPIPSSMADESFYIGVKAINDEGSDTEVWILKVGSGGAIVYVDPNATGSGSGSSWSNACTTIMAGGSKTNSGDTLIIKDGLYTGALNRLYNDPGGQGTLPASGTSSAWTTVMAENPGGVVLDGENALQPFRLKGNWGGNRGTSGPGTHDVSYMAVKGIIAGRSSLSGPIVVSSVQYVKIILCGGYDQAADSGGIINIQKSEYVLVESCYTWGHGREMVLSFMSDHVIIRRCVARMDRSTSSEPLGGFVHYGDRDGITANCIMIDSDQPDYWLNHTYLAGAYCNDCGGYCYYDYGQIQNILTTHSIALNCYGRLIVASNTEFIDIAEPPVYSNLVGWDMKAWYGNGAHTGEPASTILSRGDITIENCTFGKFRSPAGNINSGVFFNSWQDNTGSTRGDIMTNTIIYDIKNYGETPGGVFRQWNTVDYCTIHNTGTISVIDTTHTNTITTNPTANGLTYITRIEAGSPLSTAGANNTRVGAHLEFMYGKSGTLWGEPGYNVETSTPMWPFPHEDLIREKMRAYSYTGEMNNGNSGTLSGARGFCADGKQLNGVDDITLTSYIWEYTGHPIPADIYGGAAPGPTAPQNLRIVQ